MRIDVRGLTVKEDVIEDYLRTEVEKAGGVYRKLHWLGRRGAPDEFVLLPGIVGPILVETKAPGEEPRTNQKNEHRMLRRFGVRVEVIDSHAQVDALIRESRNAT